MLGYSGFSQKQTAFTIHQCIHCAFPSNTKDPQSPFELTTHVFSKNNHPFVAVYRFFGTNIPSVGIDISLRN